MLGNGSLTFRGILGLEFTGKELKLPLLFVFTWVGQAEKLEIRSASVKLLQSADHVLQVEVLRARSRLWVLFYCLESILNLVQ